jgi:hypothetical protein
MILPSKNIPTDRALLTIAGKSFDRLHRPTTVSALWDAIREDYSTRPIAYSWFILALDLLFLMSLVRFDQNGLLARANGRV